MATKQKEYRVTDAAIYTVRPVVTEHRVQIVEEIKPQSEGSGFAEFVGAVLGVLFVFWLLGAVLGCH